MMDLKKQTKKKHPSNCQNMPCLVPRYKTDSLVVCLFWFVCQNESGQLIFYERPDTDGPKLSRYSISPTSDPPGLRVKRQPVFLQFYIALYSRSLITVCVCVQAVLSDALGVKGEVRKERRLFLIGQTRVHLDTVEGLGNYMELEVSTHTLFVF